MNETYLNDFFQKWHSFISYNHSNANKQKDIKHLNNIYKDLLYGIRSIYFFDLL